MTDPITVATIAASALAGITILSLTALKGWAGWLELQRAHLGGASLGGSARTGGDDAGASPAARIELADLRERVRKLEAIAAGVDL